MTDSTKNKPKVAIVIGSGSVKCAAALGMYEVLQREGIDIDLIVGCSGGALFAALVALGVSAEDAIEKTTRMWTREVTQQRSLKDFLSIILPKQFGFSKKFGLNDDKLIMERFDQAYGNATFEDTKIPLYITATDFHTGEQVIIDSGQIKDAIRASMAIPFSFQPYQIADRLLVDGFMSDPLPVGAAISNGANIILAMGFASPFQTRISSAGRFAFQMSSIMTNNLLKAKFAFHSAVHHAELVAIVPQFAERVRLFDTSKLPYVIEEGRKSTEKHVSYLKELLNQ